MVVMPKAMHKLMALTVFPVVKLSSVRALATSPNGCYYISCPKHWSCSEVEMQREMKDIGELHYCLRITINMADKTVEIQQK